MENGYTDKHNSLLKGIIYASFISAIISLIVGNPGIIPLGIIIGIIVGALHDKFFRNKKKKD
ncbi:MAG: hypothetical protein LKG25_08320 [Prevotella sp.]|jgi:ABC-type dipeptide/oligopeptide/nickel transport system permease subunit|nr:hypothetical protein [Prevotella sp.]MCI1282581.1 hypothetical protein [Prevotella sp.]